MSVLIDAKTKCVVFGAEHANARAVGAGAPFFASAIAGRVVTETPPAVPCHWLFDAVPACGTAAEALARTGAQVAAVLSPPAEAAQAVQDCIAAGFELVVVMSDDLPPEGRARIQAALHTSPTKVIGPGSLGVVSPGQCHIGSLPHHLHSRGSIGILSRCALTASEVALQTTALGLGQSSVVDLGHNPVSEAAMIDSLCAFMADAQTEGLVLIGTAEGRIEEEAATCLRALGCQKPVVGYLEGLSEDAEPYAEAEDQVESFGQAVLSRKAAALRQAGAVLVERPSQVGRVIADLVAVRRRRDAAAPGPFDFAAAMREVEAFVYDAV